MATITVRGLDDGVKKALEQRAKDHGRSMEAEARAVLTAAAEASSSDSQYGLGSQIHALFADIGGFEFEPLPRTELPRAANFD
jgi:antitoxin FitA